ARTSRLSFTVRYCKFVCYAPRSRKNSDTLQRDVHRMGSTEKRKHTAMYENREIDESGSGIRAAVEERIVA
ncbi:unnamed protein product, partial [Mycena citricolor]